MSFPRYPEYEDSRVEWLGAIPAHWTSVPMKYLVRARSGSTPSRENEAYWDGGVPWASAKDMKSDLLSDTEDHISELALEREAASLLEAGTVLVVVRGMILARTFPVAVTSVSMAINQDLKGLVPGDRLTAAFFAWYLRGTSSESLCRLDEAGHGTKALRMDAWTSMEVALPPISEQQAIGAFLDCETGKIDTLVAEQEKLIELLKEKRQAVISHAVTKGLDPSVPMKDSRIEWLGKVPAHWSTFPLKRLISEGSSISYGIVQPGEHVEDGIPFVQTANMTSGLFDELGLQRTSESIANAYPRSKLKGGEVILGIRASIGAAHVVPPHLCGANLSRGVARIECAPLLYGNYLVFYLASSQVQMYWQLLKQGSTFNEVSIETVCNLAVALPPMAEQSAIAAFLDDETRQIDALTSEAERAIALLVEHRSALISAAVTGKIDVRGLVAEEVAA